MYQLYRLLTGLAAAWIPSLLKRRLARGKEDAARLPERLGISSKPRPQGKLVWIHAASVGEANAALPLIDALLGTSEKVNILLTTVTVTSAALMQQRLPGRTIHQFAPVDTPSAVRSFLAHWQPDIALWVDSELWPNLIMETKKRGAIMGIVNARMSEKSFRAWRYAPSLIRQVLSCFAFCFAQSAGDAERLKALGITVATHTGNLKYDAPALPCDERAFAELKGLIKERPVWLAASTHPGEEEIIARVHVQLKKSFPDLLTILIPRHAVRGDFIASQLSSLAVAVRSKRQSITPQTDIYLADTMGELGLFYRLSPIAFIGGSLVAHGGQNPLEAIRLGPAVLFGPHTENFREICEGLEKAGGSVRVKDEQSLTEVVKALMLNRSYGFGIAEKARKYAEAQSGQVTRIMNELQPYLTSAKS